MFGFGKKEDNNLNFGQQSPINNSGVNSTLYTNTAKNPGSINIEPTISNQSQLKAVRTFGSDIAELNRDGGVSMTKIALAEQTRRIENNKQPINLDEGKKAKNVKILMTIAGILILGAVIVGGFVYYSSIQKAKTQIIIEDNIFQSIIPTDANKEIDATVVDKNKFRNILVSERINDAVPITKTLFVYFTRQSADKEELITSNDFISMLKTHIPESLKRSLLPEFMYGLHSFNDNQAFIILKTDSYQTAYAGMLAWENFLVDDMKDIMVTQETVGNFIDSVIKNKDVRLIKDNSGKIALLYSLVDKETIVITTNEVTFKEILTRMANAKLIR